MNREEPRNGGTEGWVDEAMKSLPLSQENRNLVVHVKSKQAGLVCRAMLVSRFQQPQLMSKITMNVDAGSEDSCRKFILPLFLCSSLLHRLLTLLINHLERGGLWHLARGSGSIQVIWLI
jgi:hypothetical protein